MKKTQLIEILLAKLSETDSDDAKKEWLDAFINEIVDNFWLEHFVFMGNCTLCGDCGVIHTKTSLPNGTMMDKKTLCMCPIGQNLNKLKRNPEESYCLADNFKIPRENT